MEEGDEKTNIALANPTRHQSTEGGPVMKEINWAELRTELIGWYKPMRMAIDGGISWRKQSLRILSGEVRSRELVSVGGGLN